ncbi:MAG: hypothetical protein ACRETN_12590, partial [Nevskiales bacterium]
GDGRYKCRDCGYRYSWTSAWDAVRLPEGAKEQLLESFVRGLPSYRQRFLSTVNAKTRERFYRICRACCADVEQLRRPFAQIASTVRSAAHGTAWNSPERRLHPLPERTIAFELTQHLGEVKAAQLATNQHQISGRDTPLHFTGELRAWVSLPLKGNYVVLHGDNNPAPDSEHAEGIAGFWNFARHWLRPYHALPRQYFHLYLGEICYRFNRREQELKPLLQQLLQQRSIQELRPLLEPDAGAPAPSEKISSTAVAAAHFLGIRRVASHQA